MDERAENAEEVSDLIQIGDIRHAAALRELRRALRLLYGDDWQEVYEDLMVSWDPEE